MPVLHEELLAFGIADVRDRLLRGGLPPALLAGKPNPEFYDEWLDSYFARDVQELFRLEKRAAFLRGLEVFREQYPKGRNYVVSPLSGPAYERVQDDLKIVVASPGELRLAMT